MNNTSSNSHFYSDNQWSISSLINKTIPSEYNGESVLVKLYIRTYIRPTFKYVSKNKFVNSILKLIPWNKSWETRTEYYCDVY